MASSQTPAAAKPGHIVIIRRDRIPDAAPDQDPDTRYVPAIVFESDGDLISVHEFHGSRGIRFVADPDTAGPCVKFGAGNGEWRWPGA